MDRWIIFRLKVVSLKNNDDKLLINISCLQNISMSWMKISFSTIEWLNKRVLHIVYILQSRSKEFGTKIIKKYPRG